jgi:hypothetical protein
MASTRKGFRKCQTCKRNRQERFFLASGRICATCRKGTQRRNGRSTHLKRTYNITQEEYAQILEVQHGVCAICAEHRSYNLVVDHDHAIERETGDSRSSVRGLLCKRCNKMLAIARDDEDLLYGAQMYLITPPALAVLK